MKIKFVEDLETVENGVKIPDGNAVDNLDVVEDSKYSGSVQITPTEYAAIKSNEINNANYKSVMSDLADKAVTVDANEPIKTDVKNLYTNPELYERFKKVRSERLLKESADKVKDVDVRQIITGIKSSVADFIDSRVFKTAGQKPIRCDYPKFNADGTYNQLKSDVFCDTKIKAINQSDSVSISYEETGWTSRLPESCDACVNDLWKNNTNGKYGAKYDDDICIQCREESDAELLYKLADYFELDVDSYATPKRYAESHAGANYIICLRLPEQMKKISVEKFCRSGKKYFPWSRLSEEQQEMVWKNDFSFLDEYLKSEE